MENTPNTQAAPLNNFEVNQYVLSVAIEIVKTGNYVLSEACEQVRAQLRRDAFTGEVLNND